MIILVILLFLGAIVGAFLAGAVWYATSADGSMAVKRFEEDGTVMCQVHLNLTDEELKRRKFITLRCMEGRAK